MKIKSHQARYERVCGHVQCLRPLLIGQYDEGFLTKHIFDKRREIGMGVFFGIGSGLAVETIVFNHLMSKLSDKIKTSKLCDKRE